MINVDKHIVGATHASASSEYRKYLIQQAAPVAVLRTFSSVATRRESALDFEAANCYQENILTYYDGLVRVGVGLIVAPSAVPGYTLDLRWGFVY